MDCEPFDVVTLLFPFADRDAAVARPAVVLAKQGSVGAPDGAVLVAMITTGGRVSWPTDISIRELAPAGLQRSCVVRMKLNTVDCKLIAKRIGRLGNDDQVAVRAGLRELLSLALAS